MPAIFRLAAAAVALSLGALIAGRPHAAPAPPVKLLVSETVTSNAATGDGGDAWGGHQSRIVRTAAGVFTAYTTPGSDATHRNWALAWRRDGAWRVVATGSSGRDPVSLLADKNGRLWIVAWPPPFNAPQVWSGTPNAPGGTVTMSGPDIVPGNWLYTVDAAYLGAAIGRDGAIHLQVGYGSDGATDAFVYSRRDPATGTWTTSTVDTEAVTGQRGRYNYAYLLPQADGKGVWIIATRNDNWSALGYTRPPRAFGYVYDRVAVFHTADATAAHPRWTATIVRTQRQSSPSDAPYCAAAQSGGMLDSAGRVHVLYEVTPDRRTVAPAIRHAVISPTGAILDDRAIRGQANGFVRMVADARGRLFVAASGGGSTVKLYPVPDPAEGAVGRPTSLTVGAQVRYAGLMGADPRGGTPSSDVWDLGFPSGAGGEVWRYARIRLPTA